MRRQFAWLIVIACLASLFEAVGVVVAFELIQIILEPDAARTSSVLRTTLDWFEIEITDSFFVYAAVAMAIFFVIKNIFLSYATYAHLYFSNAAGMWISFDILKMYLHSPFAAISRFNSAELIVGVGQAPYIVASRILNSTVSIITESLIIIGVATVLIYSEPYIAIITGISLGASMSLYNVLIRPFYQRWGEKQLIYERAVTKSIYESIHGIKEIKLLNCQEFFLQYFIRARKKLLRINTNSAVANAIPRFISETLIICAIALVIIIVLSQERPRSEILSTLGLFAFAGFRMMPSINRLTSAFATLTFGRPALSRIMDDISSFRPDSPVKNIESMAELGNFENNIQLKNVTFSYEGVDTPTIDNVSMSIRKGQFVGIVGETGAGKTTLIDIILGMFSPQSGQIFCDNRPLDTRDRAWQDSLGYVSQEISLLDDSVRRNIAFGVNDEEIDPARVDGAIELAAINDVVSGLPHGLDTTIGERGSRLSGGERQRIGIARALYRNAEILIMDEATSALDTHTEQKIVETLRNLSGGKTIIVIAHRLSTIQNCDVVMYMENGRLLDSGTFNELRAKNETFANMVRHAEITGDAIGADSAPVSANTSTLDDLRD